MGRKVSGKLKIVALAVAPLALAGCGLAYFQPFPLVMLVQKVLPGIVFHVPTDSSMFALTFDDGPNPPYTDRILELLERYDAKATFFLTGANLERHPSYLARYREAGHQAANHMYRDRTAVALGREEFAESVERTEALICQEEGKRLLRPAGGWISPSQLGLARELGYTVVLGSAYPSDVSQPPAEFMLASLKSMLRPGAIVVLHDGGGRREQTVETVEGLLRHAAERDIRPVTLERLLAARR